MKSSEFQFYLFKMDVDQNNGEVLLPIGLIRINTSSKILSNLLDSISWPLEAPAELWEQIIRCKSKWRDRLGHQPYLELYEDKDKLMHEMQAIDNGIKEDDRQLIRKPMNIYCNSRKEHGLKVLSAFIGKQMKPNTIAKILGVERQMVYRINRVIKRQLKLPKNRTISIDKQKENNKQNLLILIEDFCSLNKHTFYKAEDVKKHIEESKETAEWPSLSSIKRYMKNDLLLTFKKVNVRFKEKWSSSDVVIKTKFMWIFNNIFGQIRKPWYIDEFNISNSSIKTYNWTTKGKQNYWLSAKRGGKINCIAAVTSEKPVHIHMQEESIKMNNFATFIWETIAKLEALEKEEGSTYVLVFDNAAIHVGNRIDEVLKTHERTAITLPPYTPEWSIVEVVINIIKRSLDYDIKKTK